MAEEKSNSIPPNEKSNETYIDKAVNLSPEGSEPSAKGLSTYHEFANEEAQQDEEISTAKFQNPLSGLSQEELFADVDKFCRDNELAEYIDVFRRGALVAQNPKTAHELEELTNEDKESLQHEIDHKWSHPWALYNLVSKFIVDLAIPYRVQNTDHFVVMCSVAAAVQGMDETVNNGAQQFYLEVCLLILYNDYNMTGD